jgi:hypothetical protein
MKLLHWQLAVAASALAAAGLGLGWMNDRSQLRRQMETLRAPAKDAPAPKAGAPKPATRNFEKEVQDLTQRLRERDREIASLRAESERLKKAAAAPAPGLVAAAAPDPKAPAKPPAPQPPLPPEAGPPPSPPGAAAAGSQPPQGQPWGQAQDSEMDELANALKLNAEQRDAVRKIILDGQMDFEKRLIAIGQKGERDINAIEREGDAVSQRVRSQIKQILYPEQQTLFDGYMNDKERGH